VHRLELFELRQDRFRAVGMVAFLGKPCDDLALSFDTDCALSDVPFGNRKMINDHLSIHAFGPVYEVR